MKTRRFIHPATVFFLLTLLVVCVSWVGSIFAWEQVQNLLSAEGLRWMLRYAGDCFTRSSLVGAVLLLFLGGGLWVNSGQERTPGAVPVLDNRRSVSVAMAIPGFRAAQCGSECYGDPGRFSVVGRYLLRGILRAGPDGSRIRFRDRFLPERCGCRTGHVGAVPHPSGVFRDLVLCHPVLCGVPAFRPVPVFGFAGLHLERNLLRLLSVPFMVWQAAQNFMSGLYVELSNDKCKLK